jgi:phosphomannomutase
VGDALTDKDGISAAIAFSELTNHLFASGVTLTQHLDNIYSKYGLFVSFNTYLFSYVKAVTETIFERLRKGGEKGGYIMEVGSAKVTRVRDITLGFDSGMADLRSTLPLTPDSHMIMYEFDNDCSIILRTSGTEPKIKCYSEKSSSSGAAAKESEEYSTLVTFVKECISFLLQPQENSLVLA